MEIDTPEVPPEVIVPPLAIPEIRVKRIFIFLAVFSYNPHSYSDLLC